MSEDKKTYSGRIVEPAKKILSGSDGLAALNNIVDSARECIKIHENARIDMAKFEAYQAVETQRIKAARTFSGHISTRFLLNDAGSARRCLIDLTGRSMREIRRPSAR